MSEPHSPDDRITPAADTSHAVAHGPAEAHSHGSHASAPCPFSDAEIKELRRNDVLGGKVVVMLMAGIFGVGLVLYSIILIAVAT